jgi:hypothetical protein
LNKEDLAHFFVVSSFGTPLPSTFPSNIAILIKLTRTDLHCAAALLTSPRFPPLQELSQPFPFPSNLDIPELIIQIKELSSTFQNLRKKSPMPKEDMSYSDKVYFLQRQLFEIIHGEGSTKLEVACATAALIFCYRMLRDVPFSFGIAGKAVKRAKEALLGVNGGQEGKGEMLFWTLGFGAIAAEGKEEGRWFLEKFGNVCQVLRVRRWEGVRGRLQSVLWGDELDEAGMRVWEEVERVMG